MIRRHEDWELRLHAAIDKRASAPFKLGRHDCCLAACALIRAMTGADLARGLRGYGDPASAADRMVPHGGVLGLARHIADAHGIAEIDPRFAQRGDAAVVMAPLPEGEGEALGVVDPSGRFVLTPAAKGWSRVPRKTALAAWRIEV